MWRSALYDTTTTGFVAIPHPCPVDIPQVATVVPSGDIELVQSFLLRYNLVASASNSATSTHSTTTSIPSSLSVSMPPASPTWLAPQWLNQHIVTPPPLAPVQPVWPLVADNSAQLVRSSSSSSPPRRSHDPAASLKYGYLYPWAEVASAFHLPINAACEVLGKRVKARMQRERLRGYPYSLSSFKKVMHDLHGLGRWPFRKLLSCERQLDEALRLLGTPGSAPVEMQVAAIEDACACIAELYRVPTVHQAPKDNASLHALLERLSKLTA